MSQPLVFFGTETSKGTSKGIYVARFDPATGHLADPVLAAATPRPSFFAFGPQHDGMRVLYVANETDEASTSMVSAFAVDPASGALRLLNQVSAAAAGPCYLSVDLTGHSVFIADYSGSTVASYSILPNGTLSPPVQVVSYKDRQKFGPLGPKHDRQDASHPHSAMLSPDNRFLVVNDLGTDQISIFQVDTASAKLGEPAFFSNQRPGSGPRHVAFHPNGRWVYGITELDNRIDQYLWSTTHSGPTSKAMLVNTDHSVITVSPDYHGSTTNTAAEVAISQDGYFLYASNRGEDSLVVFSIHADTGILTLLQRLSCGGKGPRHFTLDPTEHWLLCGNQDSGSITVFARDGGTGRLTGPVQTLPLDGPFYTLFG